MANLQLAITAFGGPETLKLQTTDIPVPADNQVLVKVAYAGVNPIDAKTAQGWDGVQRKSKTACRGYLALMPPVSLLRMPESLQLVTVWSAALLKVAAMVSISVQTSQRWQGCQTVSRWRLPPHFPSQADGTSGAGTCRCAPSGQSVDPRRCRWGWSYRNPACQHQRGNGVCVLFDSQCGLCLFPGGGGGGLPQSSRGRAGERYRCAD